LEVRYYHQDHLGSSSVMTDSNGQIASESAFYPFGHPRNDPEVEKFEDNYGFTQKERDKESGLNYFEARFLNSTGGGFISVDPIVKLGADDGGFPQLLNGYRYCRGQPIILFDPSGCLDENAVTTNYSDSVSASARLVCGADKLASLWLEVSHTMENAQSTSSGKFGTTILSQSITFAKVDYKWSDEKPWGTEFMKSEISSSSSRGQREKLKSKLGGGGSFDDKGNINFESNFSIDMSSRRARILPNTSVKVNATGSCKIQGQMTSQFKLTELSVSCKGTVGGQLKTTIPIAPTLNACRLEFTLDAQKSFEYRRDFSPQIQKLTVN
ncbi:MAG: hypothetical protein EOO01_41175, partial [Chitinophagaceae bacterium]